MRYSNSPLVLVAIGLIALSGCGNAKEAGVSELMQDKAIMVEKERSAVDAKPAPSMQAADAAMAEVKSDAGGEAATNATQSPPTINLPMLAYSYSMNVRLPLNKVVPQMRADLDKCVKAGASLCQLVNSESSETDGSANASLSIRAEPKWLETFKSGVDKDAKSSGGRVMGSSVSSEDLTLEITDTEARLRALTALRARLEKIIAERPGKLADLLEAEKELARVQGEIDSFNSQLNVAKARVQMSILRIEYSAVSSAVNNGIFEPILSAISGFFATMLSVFAFMINALAVILPIAIILIPLGFFGRNYWNMRKAKKAAKAEEAKTQ